MDVAKLKQPSEPPRVLDRLLRVTLAKLELVSTVRAARLDGETARLKPGSSPPRGATNKQLDDFRRQYAEAESNWDRLKVIRKAQRLHKSIIGNSTLAKRRGTKEWKAAIAKDTRASALVGADFGVSSSYVRKLRAEHRRGNLC